MKNHPALSKLVWYIMVPGAVISSIEIGIYILSQIFHVSQVKHPCSTCTNSLHLPVSIHFPTVGIRHSHGESELLGVTGELPIATRGVTDKGSHF